MELRGQSVFYAPLGLGFRVRVRVRLRVWSVISVSFRVRVRGVEWSLLAAIGIHCAQYFT